MHAPAIALALRERGIDAAAVTELAELRGRSDEELLAWAAGEGRAIVTENVRDFAVLVARWGQRRQDHAGVIFTNPARFHRGSRAYPADVTTALASLAETGWPAGPSEVWWL